MEGAAALLGDFLARLQAAFQSLYPESAERLSLIYYQGLLRQQLCHPETTARHIAVVGPTQVGKSTLVNLLLASEQAKASPKAGCTQHPQGFATQPLTEPQEKEIACRLPALQAFSSETVVTSNGYGLQYCKPPAHQLTERDWVVWDTPDFDSVRSTEYRYSVPAICAMADVVLVVVSKEKYADQSVWELLRLLAPARPAMCVIINKVPEEQSELMKHYVAAKFEEDGIPVPTVLTLPYRTRTHELMEAGLTAPLMEAIGTCLSGKSNPVFPLGAIHQLWPVWLAGVELELRQLEQWRQAVQQGVDEFAANYRRDYLSNTEYSDTSQRAILQLLYLLEIPGLANSLGRVRHLLTWPARQLKSLWQARLTDQAGGTEAVVIEAEYGRLLIRLQGVAGQHASTDRDGVWWATLWQQLYSFQVPLAELIQAHQQAFQPEIDLAAQALYAQLQSQPVLLNSLRAVRLTADTAGVVIALKTGGIGVNDLFLTPAMLSLVAMLTEGALGHYMASVERRLKEMQMNSLQQHLLNGLREQLLRLPQEMSQQGLFGIAESELREAEMALAELGDA